MFPTKLSTCRNEFPWGHKKDGQQGKWWVLKMIAMTKRMMIKMKLRALFGEEDKKVKIYFKNDEERILALTQAHNSNIKICSRFSAIHNNQTTDWWIVWKDSFELCMDNRTCVASNLTDKYFCLQLKMYLHEFKITINRENK